MKTYTILFTEKEIQELVALIDIAVKSVGLRIAAPASQLDKLIGDAINAEKNCAK